MPDLPLIDLGAQVPLAITVTDSSGAATNAGTRTLVITLPDQTTATASIVNTTTGAYTALYTTAQEGLHRAAWATTSPTAAFVDWFEVRSVASILSLAAARRHLNLDSGDDDDELRGHMITATEIVERYVGAITPRTVTERVGGSHQGALVLTHPVISVASVASVRDDSTSWVTADLDVDTVAGIVYLDSGAFFTGGPWNVTYTAGRRTVQHTWVQAAAEMLRHLWETQRGNQAGSPRVAGGEDALFLRGAGYTVPKRVLELVAGDRVPALG